jgi:hypothetical protein
MLRLRLTRLALGMLAIAVLLSGAGKLFLGSAFAARKVVTRLGTVIGAPVRIGEVSLGYIASELRDLHVLETLPTAEPPPWTKCRGVDADLSLWQLLSGKVADGVVTLRDASVVLRFDANNNLLTRLPTPEVTGAAYPLIRVEGGQFTIQKEGVPDAVFRGISLELRSDGTRLSLSGRVVDPEWGEWTVGGGQESPTAAFGLELRTVRPVHATPDLLRKAPFVPPVTWQHVQCDGITPCEVLVRLGGGATRTHYRVVLDPKDTKVYVPSVRLAADGAAGRVIVEDDVVTLERVRGLSAGGDLRVASRMDFAGETNVLKFSIEAGGMHLRRLPDTWQVPALEGKVTGKAELELLTRPGHRTITRGSGEGSVQMLSFLPPFRLRLEATERGFRFMPLR